MNELSENTKTTINELSIDELAKEIHLGINSRFQREKMVHVKNLYEQRIAQKSSQQNQENLKFAEKANRLSTHANVLAGKNLKVSKRSLFLALIAIIMSAISFIVPYFYR